MTSNAGARDMSRKGICFDKGYDVSRGMKEVDRLFSSEFRNRLTEIVTFQKLPPQVMEKIVDKLFGQLTAQLTAKNVTVNLTPKAKAWLAKTGYDEVFGARPLARLVQRKVRQPLAEQILFGSLENGGTATIDEGPDGLVFSFD